jgi:hypothetical protein
MTAYDQVTADKDALTAAAAVMNEVHSTADLPIAARRELQTGEAAAVEAEAKADAWLAANEPVVPPAPPPPSGTPVLPAGLTYVKTLFTEDWPGTTVDKTKWQVGVSWQENGVSSIPGDVTVADGVCNLGLPSATEGSVIMGLEKLAGPLYAQWTQKLQKAPNGGLANSTIGYWLTSPNWPTTGEIDPTETLIKPGSTDQVGVGTATLHYGANNNQEAFILAGDWSGEHVVGLHVGTETIDLYGDVNGDGVVAPLKDIDGNLVQWTTETGVSPALGPWTLMGNIGVNTPGNDFWGETVIPGLTVLGPIAVYETTA